MTGQLENKPQDAILAADSEGTSPQEANRPGEIGGHSVLVEEVGSPADPEAVNQILAAARKLFEERCSWAKFYQQILGTNGLIHRLFPTPESQTAFRRSKAYGEIQRMLAALSGRRLRRRTEQPIKIITVRVPESVHAELAREAALKGLSVNQLCVMKLVQLIEAEALATASATATSGSSAAGEPAAASPAPTESHQGGTEEVAEPSRPR